MWLCRFKWSWNTIGKKDTKIARDRRSSDDGSERGWLSKEKDNERFGEEKNRPCELKCMCVCEWVFLQHPDANENNKSGQPNKANQKWNDQNAKRSNERGNEQKTRNGKTWESVKLLLLLPAAAKEGNKKRARKTSLNYIFARRLFCSYIRSIFGRFGWHFISKVENKKLHQLRRVLFILYL